MGRAPCCDKANVKKGPWSPEEDAKLKSYIDQHGTAENWIALPQKIGLKRCGKSCRLRWLNYLRPNIKHGGFSEEEDNVICSLYISIGSRWSIIAAQLPGRTDNDIKNYWNTKLKKKLLGKQRNRRSGNNTLKLPDNNYNVNVVDQSPYWPEPEPPVLAAPVPYSSGQEQRVDSQASMRRLLIKLEGRFSDGDDHHHGLKALQDSSYTDHHHQLYEPTNQFVNSQYMSFNEGYSNVQMLQGQSSTGTFYSELQEMGYSNSPRLDGMEFLYGELDMVNNSCETIDNWGNIDTSTTVASQYGGIQQGKLLQESAFNELRYPGPGGQ